MILLPLKIKTIRNGIWVERRIFTRKNLQGKIELVIQTHAKQRIITTKSIFQK